MRGRFIGAGRARAALVERARAILLALIVCGQEVHRVASEAGYQSRQRTVEPPEDASSFPEHEGTAKARHLDIAPVAGWAWPTGTQLTVQYSHVYDGVLLGNVSTDSSASGDEVVVVASGCRESTDGGAPVMYNKIEIRSPNTAYGAAHADAVIKLVSSDDRYECFDDDYRVPVGIAARTGSVMGDLGLSTDPLELTRTYYDSVDDALSAVSKIVFMWGGTYYLCYSPDGTFDSGTNFKENVVPVSLKVLGVRSPCSGGPASATEGDGCIEDERWDCFFSYEQDGSVQNCILSFKDDGARSGWSVTTGDRSKLTWTSAFADDNVDVSTGQLVDSSSTHPQWCAVAEPETGPIFEQDTSGDILVADATTAATFPMVRSNHSEAFTVAACYCPSYDIETGDVCVGGTGSASDICCEKHEEFIQMVGVVYFWTIRICDMDNYGGVRTTGSTAGCASPYRRVLPQQKFVLRLECPPGGACEGSGNNLIKYVDQTTNSDLASWKDAHPCKLRSEPDTVVWPTAASSETLSGGSRVDYKVWYEKPVKINKSVKQETDVCYSNSNSPTYFFKVGTIKMADAFAFASKYPDHWDASSNLNKSTVQYAGYEGSFTMYSGISDTNPSPYDGNPFSGKALVWFMSYDREKLWGTGSTLTTLEKYLGYDTGKPYNAQTELNTECQKYNPSSYLMETNPLPLGQVNSNSNTNSQYQTFSGESKGTFVTVDLAGVVAVCYCAMVTDAGLCSANTNWLFAGLTTIRGPEGDKAWVFDTEVVVQMVVTGWGLSSNDRLRIIPSTGTCSANSGNPTGETSFKLGCPATDGVGCVYAESDEVIELTALSGPSDDGEQANTITGITISDEYSILEFDEDITALLDEGDVITIDYDSVVINGKVKGNELPWERYYLYQLTGEYQYQDTLDASVVTQSYIVGHTVSYVYTDGVVEPNQISIPIGWTSDVRPTFTFPAVNSEPGGRWTRRNTVQSAETMKGVTATSTALKVCWGVWTTGSTMFYKQAGTLTFVDPDPLTQAQVFLTTKQAGAIAPAVLYFQTGSSRTEYATTTAKTKLTLRFLDVRADDGVLVPYFAQDNSYTCGTSGGCAGTITSPESVSYANAKQYLCGKLFTELWSEDSEGFPVPSACYYSAKYRDGPETGSGTTNTNNFFRELTLVFQSGNGLRANTKYMIVMNAKNPVAIDASDDVAAIDLFSMCAEEEGCERPYKVFEKSTAELQTTTVARDSDLNNPRFASGGFYIQTDGDSGHINLSDKNIITVLLQGGAGQKAIKAQAIIRMILWPITQWSIGSASCTATCTPFEEDSAATCDGSVGCTPEAIVSTSLHNAYQVVKIRLPTDMTDITDEVMHTLKISSLTLPLGGFFPTRTGVQLTQDDDTDPSYTTSRGMIWKNPDEGRTEGRLVLTGPTGSGPNPFAGDTDNKIVIRLQFGTTIWNWGDSRPAATIEIRAPPEYVCSVSGTGEPDSDLDVFAVDSDDDGYPDNRRGLLSVEAEDGDYERSDGRSCWYEVGKYGRIYDKQVVYIELDIENPSDAFRRDDSTNKWYVQLSSKGALSSLGDFGVSHPIVYFTNNSAIQQITNGPDYFAGNAAVIGELVDPLFQPGAAVYSMARSCCSSTFSTRSITQYMRVFFKPGVSVGQKGYVIVDAPDTFDFGAECKVEDLDDDYYAYTGEGELILKVLKAPVVCTGSKYPQLTATTYNRATVRVGGLIDVIDLTYYGFQIAVSHPYLYSTDMHSEWRLWLEDASGYSLEGSKETVGFNPMQSDTQTLFYHKSWGLYNEYIEDIKIYIANLRPYSITNAYTTIAIYPLLFDEATETSLRITAPYGFIWSTDSDDYISSSNCSSSCVAFGGSSVLPAVESTVTNTLIFTQVYFNPNVKYGFQHKIRVPDFNPRTSANSFFFEFGYENSDIEDRVTSAVVDSPTVAALINCKVGFNSNQVGYSDNRMQFYFQTVSTIGIDAGLVIAGNANAAGFTFSNEFSVLAGSDELPSDITLTVLKEADSTPRITLKVEDTPIAPGYYMIELTVANPATRILTAGEWTFGSYTDVSDYPTKHYLDNEMVAPGFVINSRMSYAGFYTLTETQLTNTGREDRPGYTNNLVIEFELNTRPDVDMQMLLKAPLGFEFEDDCLGTSADPRLITNYNSVFGENTGGDWPSDLTVWLDLYAPTACTGDGRDAIITIPVGLELQVRYAFRIRVQNPTASPDWNKWTVTYNDESSDPFAGFSIWTSVSTATVDPVTYSRNQGGTVDPIVNPVTITFQPYKSVPAKPDDDDRGGCIRVEIPSGFQFVHENYACEVDLRVTGASSSIASRHLECEVDSTLTKLNLYMVGSVQIYGEESGSGQEYQLIVYVYNPTAPQSAADWYLYTYEVWTRESEYSLDESTMTGFAVINDLWKFTVSNPNSVQNGNVDVTDVTIVLNFRDNVKDGDQIIVYAPVGFDLVSNAETNECNNYRPVGASPDWFPYTGEPECECNEVGPTCWLTWQSIQEGSDPAFSQKTDLTFKISTVNPSKTPDIADNYWMVQHLTSLAVVQAEKVAESWAIVPQLADVTIAFANGYRSAGSTANLQFTMTPVNDACCVEITAEYPTNFDFSQSTVLSNYDILAQDGSRIVINMRSPGFVADSAFTFIVYSVVLGRSGGQTRWNIVTYEDTALTSQMDEVLDYEDGAFRLPGKITLVDTPELTSAYKESQSTYPVKSLFQPRVAEWSTAEFQLSFSQTVYCTGILVITSQGSSDDDAYLLRTDGFVIIGTAQIAATASMNTATGALEAVLKPSRPASEVALVADTTYTVSVRVYPQTSGTNTWRFDTTDAAAGFTNTNDGESDGFSPVEQYTLLVSVARSPPMAVIEVTLSVDYGDTVIRELVVVAPAGFIFESGSDGCGDMCTAGQALGSTGRRTATIATETGQPLTDLTGIIVKVQTPEATPSGSASEGTLWFVEGRGQGSGTTKGWGEGAGFAVTQMSGSAVYYGGVAGLKGHEILFTFTLDVDAGSTITVVPPDDFLLTCSTDGSLSQGSLPGGTPSCVDDPMTLTLQSTLTIGTYSFGVMVDLPDETPQVNTFNIIIEDAYNNVVDAAYGVSGQVIVSMAATTPTLAWASADPGQTTTVTMGVTFTSAVTSLEAILITLPETFQHDIQLPIDVQNYNAKFPLTSGLDWADSTEEDRIVIWLDDSEDVTTIPAGTYKWSFPVLVPPTIPDINIWYISLCEDRSCSSPYDGYSSVSFPISGFNLYEVSPEAAAVAASPAERRTRPSRLFASLLLCEKASMALALLVLSLCIVLF